MPHPHLPCIGGSCSLVAAQDEEVLNDVQHGVELGKKDHAVAARLQDRQHPVKDRQLPARLHQILPCEYNALESSPLKKLI